MVARPSIDAWRTAALIAIVVYQAVATFPPASLPPSPTLDGSWIAEINRLARVGGFGRNVAFTSGPLGFLLYPMDVGAHLEWAAVFRFAVISALTALAVARLSRSDLFGAAVFAWSQVTAVTLGLPFEYQVLLLLPIAASAVVEAQSVVGLVALAAVAALLVFVKLNIAVGAVAVLATASAVWVLRGEPSRWLALAVACGAYAMSLAVTAAWLLPSLADLAPWLRLGADITSGYSEAMSSVGPQGEAILAAAFLAAGVIGAVHLTIRGRPAGLLLLCSVGPAFLAFKHAFVRQDPNHVPGFFPFVLAVLGFALADMRRHPGERMRSRGLVVATLAAALGAAWVATASYPGIRGPWLSKRRLASVITARAGVAGIARWVDLRDMRATHGLESLAADRSAAVRSCGAGRRVGVLPWELAVCQANALDCIPNPTLQSYSAYTSELDRASAARYTGAGAPDVVLARFEAIDGRNVALDTPFLWRALLRGYRPIGTADSFLCLERRGLPLEERDRVLETTRAAGDAWTDVPPHTGRVLLRADLRLTTWGLLVRTLFRVPPVMLNLRHASGRISSYRLVPGTARDGLPIDEAPEAPEDFALALGGEPVPDRVVAVSLDGPGLVNFKQPVPMVWIETERVARGAVERPQ